MAEHTYFRVPLSLTSMYLLPFYWKKSQRVSWLFWSFLEIVLFDSELQSQLFKWSFESNFVEHQNLVTFLYLSDARESGVRMREEELTVKEDGQLNFSFSSEPFKHRPFQSRFQEGQERMEKRTDFNQECLKWMLIGSDGFLRQSPSLTGVSMVSQCPQISCLLSLCTYRITMIRGQLFLFSLQNPDSRKGSTGSLWDPRWRKLRVSLVPHSYWPMENT